jgi:hypothetical protein
MGHGRRARNGATHTMITLIPGTFLPSHGETCFRSLDGSDVALWLSRQGYEVTDFHDTGRNGQAITACGFVVSTNGYVSRLEDGIRR